MEENSRKQQENVEEMKLLMLNYLRVTYIYTYYSTILAYP